MTRKGGRDWSSLVQEFTNANLVPASDPNVPSQTHRILINGFLMDMAQKAPMLFGSKLRNVALRVLTSAGINDADALLASPQEIQQAMQQQKGAQGVPPGQGGDGGAAKAQLELPLKQAQLQLDQQKIQGEQAIENRKLDVEDQENQREAANQAAQHTQRQQELDNQLQIQQAELAHESDKLAVENQPEQLSALDLANLRKADAQGFSAMGTGAMGFAKASQTVQQGEQELSTIDQDINPGSGNAPAKPAAPRLQRPGRGRKPSGSQGGDE
jgi:hypothetical protein